MTCLPVEQGGAAQGRVDQYLKPTTANSKQPTYAGAALVVMINKATTVSIAVGHALRHGHGPIELAAAKPVAMRRVLNLRPAERRSIQVRRTSDTAIMDRCPRHP